MDNLRSIIANKILSSIPPRAKSIEYLMETLEISRESVYRRIRGDISFSLDEITKLASELGFSLDELIIKDMNSRIFFDLHVKSTQKPSDVFTTIYKKYFHNIFDNTYTKDIESIMILNHISPEFIIPYNNLLKFSYYRWMHQNQESSLKYFFSDVILPDQLIILQRKASEYLKMIKNNNFIIDSNVFLNLIMEIQYYYKRKLITDNELFQIKNDLLGLVNMVESITQTGNYCSDAKYNFYLSSFNIESSSRYIKYDGHVKSIFFLNSIEPIIILNEDVCVMHKKWIDSMRKYSTLITQSNEILQVRYFNKQRSYIEKIGEHSSIVSL